MKILLALISSITISLTGALQASYPFSAVLLDEGGQYYELHWNFSRSTETIYFAVNVSTTGWVGLGLSPNGQMPGSDVVIGWVDGTGEAYFGDRYAEGRFLPPIDESQDWFLTNSEEENGYTVLEFFRNLTSCDPRDLDITSSTARVVWSFSVDDPSNPSGSDARQHDYQGSASLNLLGRIPGSTVSSASGPAIEITVSNVSIPSADTTYWCATFRLPDQLINTTHFINQISPVITPHAQSFVHHILVYLCNEQLTEEEVGLSEPCSNIVGNADQCRGGGTLVGAWAVGGEDFVYPEGVAYSVGGTGQEHFVLMEMHYDNPEMRDGVMDSSGLRFHYNTEEPENRAGILMLGHSVTPRMAIPPRTENFTIAGICSADCTSNFIPAEGLTIFANGLHTHVIGRALTVQHFRYSEECGAFEELEPIDENLSYDFNFQQTTHLPRKHTVLRGDVIVLKCEYNSLDIDRITLGGESTLEEMCLTFLTYYPRPAGSNILTQCLSFPRQETYLTDFISFLQGSSDTEAAAGRLQSGEAVASVLSELNWEQNPNLATALQDSVLHDTALSICAPEFGSFSFTFGGVPETNCSYQRPEKCSRNPEPPEQTSTQGQATTTQGPTSSAVGMSAMQSSLLLIIGSANYLLF